MSNERTPHESAKKSSSSSKTDGTGPRPSQEKKPELAKKPDDHGDQHEENNAVLSITRWRE